MVFLEIPDPRVELTFEKRCRLLGPVVDDHDLEVRERLVEDALHGFAQPLWSVVVGDHDADGCHRAVDPLPRSIRRRTFRSPRLATPRHPLTSSRRITDRRPP